MSSTVPRVEIAALHSYGYLYKTSNYPFILAKTPILTPMLPLFSRLRLHIISRTCPIQQSLKGCDFIVITPIHIPQLGLGHSFVGAV